MFFLKSSYSNEERNCQKEGIPKKKQKKADPGTKQQNEMVVDDTPGEKQQQRDLTVIGHFS